MSEDGLTGKVQKFRLIDRAVAEMNEVSGQ